MFFLFFVQSTQSQNNSPSVQPHYSQQQSLDYSSLNGSLASAASAGCGSSSAVGNSTASYFNRYASPESAMSPSISSVATSTSEVSLFFFFFALCVILEITVSIVNRSCGFFFDLLPRL